MRAPSGRGRPWPPTARRPPSRPARSHGAPTPARPLCGRRRRLPLTAERSASASAAAMPDAVASGPVPGLTGCCCGGCLRLTGLRCRRGCPCSRGRWHDRVRAMVRRHLCAGDWRCPWCARQLRLGAACRCGIKIAGDGVPIGAAGWHDSTCRPFCGRSMLSPKWCRASRAQSHGGPRRQRSGSMPHMHLHRAQRGHRKTGTPSEMRARSRTRGDRVLRSGLWPALARVPRSLAKAGDPPRRSP